MAVVGADFDLERRRLEHGQDPRQYSSTIGAKPMRSRREFLTLDVLEPTRFLAIVAGTPA